MVSIRCVALALLFAASATATHAQDAALLDTLRQSFGKTLPASLRINAAGSEYVPADGARQYVRIQSFTQQLDLAAPRLSEQIVALDSGKKEPRKTERTAGADSSWADQSALWTTPAGFVTAATKSTPEITTETILGRSYRVVTVKTPSGGVVRGYVTEANVLERTRTEIEAPGRGKLTYEAIFHDWKDFDGVKYPNVIIHKENDELARVLVVDSVTTGGTTAAAAAPRTE